MDNAKEWNLSCLLAALVACSLICVASCAEFVADDALPMPVLGRLAEKSGFHRVVVTELFLPVPDKFSPSACEVVLIESIPSGMYLDLDELGSQVNSDSDSSILMVLHG